MLSERFTPTTVKDDFVLLSFFVFAGQYLKKARYDSSMLNSYKAFKSAPVKRDKRSAKTREEVYEGYENAEFALAD